jgi:hypothetical protein
MDINAVTFVCVTDVVIRHPAQHVTDASLHTNMHVHQDPINLHRSCQSSNQHYDMSSMLQDMDVNWVQPCMPQGRWWYLRLQHHQ